jgi:ADP-heptose:LPS heptosyltransferase
MGPVLIIKLGALGDVVIATAAIHSIQQSHAGAPVWLLTGEAFAGLFADWQGLQVRTMQRRGALPILQTIGWIRQQGFARIYDLQSNDRSAILCACSGVRERVGNHPRFPYTLHPPNPHGRDVPGYERLAAMLAAAGIAAPDARPRLPIAAAQKQAVSQWMQTHGLAPGRFAVMHAGASPNWPAKRWPHFAGLAQALEQRGLRVVWLGAGGDRTHNATLARQAGIDATDAFSIPQLAALAEHARFAVTNDSGPMHAIAAAGIPVYGLFGPTNWRRSHALGQRTRALFNDVECPACARADRATATDHRCLPGLSAAWVIERLAADGLV